MLPAELPEHVLPKNEGLQLKTNATEGAGALRGATGRRLRAQPPHRHHSHHRQEFELRPRRWRCQTSWRLACPLQKTDAFSCLSRRLPCFSSLEKEGSSANEKRNDDQDLTKGMGLGACRVNPTHTEEITRRESPVKTRTKPLPELDTAEPQTKRA